MVECCWEGLVGDRGTGNTMNVMCRGGVVMIVMIVM